MKRAVISAWFSKFESVNIFTKYKVHGQIYTLFGLFGMLKFDFSWL